MLPQVISGLRRGGRSPREHGPSQLFRGDSQQPGRLLAATRACELVLETRSCSCCNDIKFLTLGIELYVIRKLFQAKLVQV
jgi:hypothetical protein